MRTTGRQLEILSYKATLERGYAVVRDGDQIVTRRKEAAGAQNLSIEFADGPLQISAAVAGAPSADLSGPQPPKEAPSEGPATPVASPSAPKPRRKPKVPPSDDSQGSLF